MKKQNSKTLSVALLCCAFWNTACVNEVDTEIKMGNIPITFSAKVSKPSTKATDTAFSKGDKVGLFAVLSSTSMTEKRYIDNIALICSNSSTLIPQSVVFYPEGDAALDFISYYPYQSEGVTKGSSTITVSVHEDQSNIEKRSQSDFMVAKASDITSSTQAVTLKYQHKLSKLKITLIPNKKENVNDMLKANPQIIASGFKTKADYNLEQEGYSNLRTPTDIIASGEWEIKDGTLVGKEFIMIPQTTNSDDQNFIMDWNGRIYSCSMPQLDLAKSTECEITISAMQTNSNMLSSVIASIEDWNDAAGGNTDNQGNCSTVHIASLSFSQSNLYHIYHDGEAVAEICKEYLNSDKVKSKAITAYPILENGKADLSQGVVLQLLDHTGNVHGGKISWDKSTNSFSYEAGKSAAITQFYMDTEKKILLEKPENAINFNIVNYVLRDIRDGQLKEYPIVKIGTQYWMRTELHATSYQNGEALTQRTTLGQGAGYMKYDKYELYFYNGEALTAGKLAPTDWKIPSTNDWERLKTYVNDDASLIKTGEWQTLVSGNPQPNTNLTYFTAQPVGMWYNIGHNSLYKMTAFWSWDEVNQKPSSQTIFLSGESKEFILQGTLITNEDYYKGLTIRCIKE